MDTLAKTMQPTATAEPARFGFYAWFSCPASPAGREALR
jgi:hypothetical protein